MELSRLQGKLLAEGLHNVSNLILMIREMKGMSCKSSIHYGLIAVSKSILLHHMFVRCFLHGLEILLSLKWQAKDF
jgi:hypothetical protein